MTTTSTFFARPIKTFEFSPGGWQGCRIGVFEKRGETEVQIGEYERNYGGFFDTFFPFRANGKNLALYSSDYTSTRIMELPSCKDLGGEERNEMGFCPVEYFVPTFIDQEIIQTTNNKSFPPRRVSTTRINNPSGEVLTEFSSRHEYTNFNTGQECEDVLSYRPLTPITYYPFGFVAGCIWGDESTWKVQYLDLSKADQGVLVREERFGYIELIDGISLQDSIDMTDYAYDPNDEDAYRIRIKSLQTFDLKSGTPIDPFN